jgi:hypothetical protein
VYRIAERSISPDRLGCEVPNVIGRDDQEHVTGVVRPRDSGLLLHRACWLAYPVAIPARASSVRVA